MKRFELTNDMWGRLETVLKADKLTWRGKADNKRIFVEGVLSLLKDKKLFSTSLNWGNLNSKYGNPQSQCRTFNRWRNDGIWEKLLPIFAERANYAWVADLGTYEVLLKNGKYLSKINKHIKDCYIWEKNNLNENIEILRTEIKQQKKEIEDRENLIGRLHYEIERMDKQAQSLYQKERVDREVATLKKQYKMKEQEIVDLTRLLRKYAVVLYSRFGYSPTGREKMFINKYENIASELKRKMKSTDAPQTINKKETD